ncbi:MAG: integrase arm-type DNA-binding domain-containing protein [Rhodobacteraceae bacterium]|nr:integrase arm-type DNA-binding domain-containing protein [Paracoccaceae bacterium]
MSRARHKLSVTKIKNTEIGVLYDGGGLQLQMYGKNRGKWIYRYCLIGNRRDMGLGTYPSIGLADARSQRDAWERKKNRGIDPISARDEERAKENFQQNKYDPTVAKAIDHWLENNKDDLKRGGKAGRWRSPLDVHVIPKLGKRRVSTLTVADIKRVLAPLWKSKVPTSEKVAQRTRLVLKHCHLHECTVDPQIVNKATEQLGAQSHVTRHIEATPWEDVPSVYGRLHKKTSSHLALRFLILTAARAASICGAQFSEIENDVWTVPPLRIKGREGKTKEVRIPLSLEALRIAEDCRRRSKNGFLFPGHRNKAIHGNALLKVLNEMGEEGRPHGFRSSFKDWTRETEAGTWQVAETSLSHVVGGTVERSYHRSDLLAPRRALMLKWSQFVCP